MKKIYTDTSSVRKYHIYQDVITKLTEGEKVEIFLKLKENDYEDVFCKYAIRRSRAIVFRKRR